MSTRALILSLTLIYAALLLVASGALPIPVVIGSLGLAACLIWVSVVDIRQWVIPDLANAAILALGLMTVGTIIPDRLPEHLLAAGLGGGLLWIVSEGFYRWRGFEGLGLGDAKLFGAGGIWVGLAGLPSVLLMASVAGVAFGMLVTRKKEGLRSVAIPFGPFLAISIWIVWLYGSFIG